MIGAEYEVIPPIRNSGGAFEASPWPATPGAGPDPTGLALPFPGQAANPASPYISPKEYGDVYEKGGYQCTLRMLHKLGANETRANEFAQDAWGLGFERLDQLRNKDRVVQWVNSIARHRLISELRRQKHVCPLSPAHDRAKPPAVNRELARVLQMCTERQRELFMYVYVMGYSNSDVAKRLGVSPGAVHSRLSRARRALRTQLEPKGNVRQELKRKPISKEYGTANRKVG